jgi:NADH-quinone oxidoreductase subunit N
VNLSYAELAHGLLPETALVVGAFLVLGFDLTVGRRNPLDVRLRHSVAIGVVAVLAAALHCLRFGAPGPVFGDAFAFDSLALVTRIGLLVLALFTLGISAGAPRPAHPAEYVALLLFATTGMLLMAAADQLLLVFLAVELTSLSLYVLTGFDRSRRDSAEAALKYFLFGGLSAAFLLFGFSLVYGLTGSISLPEIATQLSLQPMSSLLVVALVMILVALGFKVAAAPFHLWAPDVYQGAPTPSAALISSASKLAGFTLIIRLLWLGLGAAAGSLNEARALAGWLPAVALVSAASLLLGNLAALAQHNLRRLLAYSAIAHSGALLLGVIAAGKTGPGAVIYYASTYGLATVGAFGVIAVVERAGPCQEITDLAGLRRRSPFLAGCLLVFLLSLAGIPPLAGFVGKFAVFSGALQMGGLAAPGGWLALLAILLSAVGLYYYLLVLKQAFVVPAAPAAGRVRVDPMAAATLLCAASLLIVLGLFPSLLLQMF